MAFYQSIANYYDDIFPYNPAQLEFVKSCVCEPHCDRSVLDIGCGTGNLSIEMAKHFNRTVGIDLDKEMLEIAIEKIAGNSKSLSFLYQDMMEIDHAFGDEWFGAIVCFGNTLVHLNSLEMIQKFIKETRTRIKPKRKLLIQIINYYRILKYDVPALATIENDKVKFERNYRYNKQNHKIEFETILTVKNESKEIKNQIDLYPLTQDELNEILVHSGYANFNYFGSFKKDVFNKDRSVPLIVEAY